MEKAVILESVALQPDGGVTVRLQKVVNDGDDLISREPHLFTMTSERTVEEGLSDLDRYLVLNKWPKLSAADRKFILGHAGTPAVVQARASASNFAQSEADRLARETDEHKAAIAAEAEARVKDAQDQAQAAIDAAVNESERAVQAAENDRNTKVADAEKARAAAEKRAQQLEQALASAQAENASLKEAQNGFEARLKALETAAATS